MANGTLNGNIRFQINISNAVNKSNVVNNVEAAESHRKSLCDSSPVVCAASPKDTIIDIAIHPPITTKMPNIIQLIC